MLFQTYRSVYTYVTRHAVPRRFLSTSSVAPTAVSESVAPTAVTESLTCVSPRNCLLGLYARDNSGEGQELLTSMLCSNMYANSDELIDYGDRPEPPRVDRDLLGLGPLYRLYEATEGWVFLACLRVR